MPDFLHFFFFASLMSFEVAVYTTLLAVDPVLCDYQSDPFTVYVQAGDRDPPSSVYFARQQNLLL